MRLPDDDCPTAAPIWGWNPAQWLAAIVESSEDAIVGRTLDGIIRSWNSGATRVFGYTADEIIGRSVLVLIPPDRHDEERAIVAALSRGERIECFETVRLRRDGSAIDVSLSVSPIRDESGRVVGAAKVARDITESNRLRCVERELSDQLREQTLELERQMDEAQSLEEELERTNDELRQVVERLRVARRVAGDVDRVRS